MSDAKLYLIPFDNDRPIEEIDPGPLTDGCPSFDLMRSVLDCDTIEHVGARYQGANVHLFCDEEGLLKDQPQANDRATALQVTHLRFDVPRLVDARVVAYNNLNDAPPMNAAVAHALYGCLIVGDAMLWTGELE